MLNSEINLFLIDRYNNLSLCYIVGCIFVLFSLICAAGMVRMDTINDRIKVLTARIIYKPKLSDI